MREMLISKEDCLEIGICVNNGYNGRQEKILTQAGTTGASTSSSRRSACGCKNGMTGVLAMITSNDRICRPMACSP